jgi:hypothetical protein
MMINMCVLNEEDWNDFIGRVTEDLKHPVGPTPTPKLEEAVRKINELIEKKKKEKKHGKI